MYLTLKILRKHYVLLFRKNILNKSQTSIGLLEFLKEQYTYTVIKNTKKYNYLKIQFRASFKYLAV